MTEELEFIEDYRGWRIYYGAVVAREQDEEGVWHDIIGYKAFYDGAATVSGRTLEAAKHAIDEWIDHYKPPPNGDGVPPHACMIAFLFGSTVLKGVFPILRMFRDKVMPKVTVRLYYTFSGWCLCHG